MRITNHRIIPIAEGIEEKGNRYSGDMKNFLTYTVIWRKIIGNPVKKNTYVYKYSGGILYIKCRSAVWANELSMLREEILHRLHTEGNCPEIKELRFDHINFHNTEKPEQKPVPEITVSEETEKEAERIASAAAAPELREAIKKAYIAQQKAEIYEKSKNK